MGYICFKCDQVVNGSIHKLLCHLRNRHALLVGRMFTCPVTCGQDGCHQTFRYSAAFKSHIEKKHNETDNDNGDNDDDIRPDDLSLNNDDSDPEIEAYNAPVIHSKEDVTKLAGFTIAKLKASSSVVQSTIDNVVCETSSLFSDVINSLKCKTENFLESRGIAEDDDGRKTLLSVFDDYQFPFEKLGSAYQQQKYFTESGYFVKPVEVPFAVAYYPRNDPNTGHVNQIAKPVTFQYIPITELLKCVLQSKGFMRTILQYKPSDDGIMRDFHDGEFSRAHVFFSDPKNISLLLYVDDCEIANPLGSKAGLHKIGVIYCMLLNLPPKFRSSLCNCYLVALYNAGDVKTYGFEVVLRPLVNDIKLLEREGLHVDTDVFEGTVQVSVAQVTGDNLGLNGICGYVESFVSNHFCRICTMHRIQMHAATIANQAFLRDSDNYEHDLQLNDPSATGVKGPCVLNEIQNFHVTTNYAPDIMHDLLEGVCGLEFHLVLAALIDAGFFDLDLINSRITSFDYASSDSKNKPSPIVRSKIQHPDGATGQTAAQMWCLIRYFPLMVADKVPEDNEHLELILLLLECMDFIFSPEITVEETIFLKQLIKDHHDHFLLLYPERNLKPKHHFMTHYPQEMQLLGPLTTYWTMRFEAKHRFFKRLGHIVCNFRNILKTLANRQQMFLCYNLMSGKDLEERDTEVGPGSSLLVVSLDRAEFLSRILGLHLFEELYVAEWCFVHGIKYHKNILVITKKSDDLVPIFERIVYVICVEKVVKLITEALQTVRYDRHSHTYAVQPTQEPAWSVISVDSLYDRQPYHASKAYNYGGDTSYVTLRHRIY